MNKEFLVKVFKNSTVSHLVSVNNGTVSVYRQMEDAMGTKYLISEDDKGIARAAIEEALLEEMKRDDQ